MNRNEIRPLAALALAGVVAAGCAARPAPEPVLPVISQENLASDIRTLASDEFEGRRPATAGEEKTVAYIESAFRAAGLRPGAGEG